MCFAAGQHRIGRLHTPEMKSYPCDPVDGCDSLGGPGEAESLATFRARTPTHRGFFEGVSHHRGGDESFSISHIGLRFVYRLGQRYMVEIIHVLVLDILSYLGALVRNVSSHR